MTIAAAILNVPSLNKIFLLWKVKAAIAANICTSSAVPSQT
jgi:hypothetical protein